MASVRTLGKVRKQRQLRAFDDEWEAIKEFSRLIKRADNKEQLIRFMNVLGDIDDGTVTKVERELSEADKKASASLLSNLYSVLEASKIWGISTQSISKALDNKSFTPYEAKRLSNGERKVWIVTRAGMLRLFGRPTNEKLQVLDESEQT